MDLNIRLENERVLVAIPFDPAAGFRRIAVPAPAYPCEDEGGQGEHGGRGDGHPFRGHRRPGGDSGGASAI